MPNRYHVRSISFPSRSHPTTRRVEEELNKFVTWSSSTSESISSGLSGLEDLYECVEDLLNMGSTQQVLSRHQDEKCVDELVDGSVKLLDICGILRDLMLQTNEHARALQSALRRRKGDSSIETSITSYNCFRKKMKKDVKKLIMALKQVDKNFEASPAGDQDDDHLYAVIRVLREVCGMNISIFQSLCMFLTVSGSKTKSSRWSLVSKLMHKGSVVALACEDKEAESVLHEMDGVDSVLCVISLGPDHAEKMQIGLERLKALEKSINGLENGLECVFRRLIKMRTSLLNIISQ